MSGPIETFNSYQHTILFYKGAPKNPWNLHSPGIESWEALPGTAPFNKEFFLTHILDLVGRTGWRPHEYFFAIPNELAKSFIESKFRGMWVIDKGARNLAGEFLPAGEETSKVIIRQDMQATRLLVCDWLENIFQERAGSDHGARQLFGSAKAYVAGTDHGNDDVWRASEKDLLVKQSNVMSQKSVNYFSYMATLGVRKALEDMDTEADILEAAHKLTLAPDAPEGTKGRFDPAKFNDFTDPLVWSIQGSMSPVWQQPEEKLAAAALYQAYRERSAAELLHHTEYPFDPGFAASLAAPTGEAHHLRTAALASLRPSILPPILLTSPPPGVPTPTPRPDPKL